MALAAIHWISVAIAAWAEDSSESPDAAPIQVEEVAHQPSQRQEVPSAKVRLALQRQNLLMALEGPPDAVWIEVDGEKIPGFWRADQSGRPLGAVLILPAQAENARWSQTLAQLHHHLPKHGWATLSVELPELPEPAIPQRPSPVAPVDAPDSASTHSADETSLENQETEPATSPPPPATQDAASTTIEETRSAIQRKITAATAYLHQQGQYNLVLIGEGVSALWVLEHLGVAVAPPAPKGADENRKAIVERAIRAVVLLDAQTPNYLQPTELTERLRFPQVPTLDLYTDPTIPARNLAAQRKQASIKAGYEVFVQRQLAPPAGPREAADPAETRLTKAIRGFLQRHAQGVAME